MRQFRDLWQENLAMEPWQTLKALTRKLGVDGKDEYRYLKPVADFRARLIVNIRPFLDVPNGWRPSSGNDQLRTQAIENVASKVATTVEDFAKDRVLAKHAAEWLQAYSHRGPGSTVPRKRDIDTICGYAAPIPRGTADPVANAFMREMRTLVRSAIESGGGKLIGLDDHP